MRVENLRNYGKGLMDSVPDHRGMERIRQAKRTMQSELRRELGLAGLIRVRLRIRREIDRMRTHDWSSIRQHGLTNERFLYGIIERIALMKTLADMVGMERASAIQRRLLRKTMYDLMAPMWPTVEEYQECGDFFEVFKTYFRASMAANVRAGLHEMEVVEDSTRALAFNVTYCAWHEVAKEFGDPYLCYPSTCYGDEVSIPMVLDRVGYRFSRRGTLATAAPVCDFRFEPFGGSES